MKKDNNKVIKIVFGVFLWFGVFFWVLGIFIGIGSNKFREKKYTDYDAVTATISEIYTWKGTDHKHHEVYLDYTYKGEKYEHISYNKYSSSMREGDIVEIRVKKDNPTRFYMADVGFIIAMSFGGFGFLFILIGGIPLIIVGRKEKHMKKLLESGRQLWGVISSVTNNPSITVNGRHPQIFNVVYEDDSIVTVSKLFKSKSVWIEGDRERFVGRNIKICVNPDNYDDYVVDLDSVQTD